MLASALVVEVVVVLIKRNGIINNLCARTTPRARGKKPVPLGCVLISPYGSNDRFAYVSPAKELLKLLL